MTIALVAFAVIVSLRAFDLFVLRPTAWPDPDLPSRALSLLLLFVYLRSLGRAPSDIGMHARALSAVLIIGCVVPLAFAAAIYGVQWLELHALGASPEVFIGLIRPSGAVTAAALLYVYFIGQLLNALSEECLFRGLILPWLMRRCSFWCANVLQALLFAVGHLIWPFSRFVLGHADASEALVESAMLLVFTFVGGLIFGYLYYRTANLWTAILAHLVDNSVWLFFHISTATQLDAELGAGALTRLGFVLLPVFAWWMAKVARIAPLEPWGVRTSRSSSASS